MRNPDFDYDRITYIDGINGRSVDVVDGGEMPRILDDNPGVKGPKVSLWVNGEYALLSEEDVRSLVASLTDWLG